MKFQVGANITLVGSKHMGSVEKEQAKAKMPSGLIVEVKTTDGQSLGIVTAGVREFKTGSIGYYANGKVHLED